jgi:hypothetical protein
LLRSAWLEKPESVPEYGWHIQNIHHHQPSLPSPEERDIADRSRSALAHETRLYSTDSDKSERLDEATFRLTD